MMWVEALIVVLIAVVVGSLVAIPPLVGISLGVTGSPVPAVPPLGYASIVGATALLHLLSIGLPTRLTVRHR